jgi:hypothetical protein
MKVKLSRIAPQLTLAGFQPGFQCCTGSFALVRVGEHPELFEWIRIDTAGKRHEAVFAYVSVCIAKWIGIKGIMESMPFLELGEDRERGWTIIESDEKAREWEQKLIGHAPGAVVQFAAEHGPALLESTRAARLAVHQYLQRLSVEDCATSALASLRQNVGDTTRDEADRLMNWAAVQQIPDHPELYELACLCLLRFSSEVEGQGITYFGQDPLENSQLMWRIQLLVDRLFSRFGYQPH